MPAGTANMRRYAYLILFTIVLVTPVVMHLVSRGHTGARIAAASDVLTIISPHNQDIRREFQRAFSDWHERMYGSAVRIVYLNPGGTADIRRLLERKYAAHRGDPAALDIGIDLVWGGGDYFFDGELRPLGVLQSMRLDPRLLTDAFPATTLSGVKLLDTTRDATGRLTPQWVGVCLSGFGIVYNPDLYATLDLPAPAAWADLTDPKLADLVALADPTHSGSAAVAFLMVLHRAMADAEAEFFEAQPDARRLRGEELNATPAYTAAIAAGWKKGMAQLLLIAANARYFSSSASQVPHDVGNGQAAAGMAIDFYGRVYQESVGPQRCRVVMPQGATAITPDPVGILAGVRGRQLELALHFVEFLLSREGQLLWILRAGQKGGPVERGLRRPPIRRDLYADRTGWTDDINPFEEKHGFTQRPEWNRLFSDTRPIWAAAWIDARDWLKSAHRAILSVPDESRRDALLRELADLPIEMSDVQRLMAERRAATEARRGEEWKAANRIHWTKVFRDHYRQVRQKAMEAARTP